MARTKLSVVVFLAFNLSLARAAPPAPLYKMPPVKPWPATTDPGTEEAVPGLAPTDGYAINATTPNLEPLAPMLEYARPIGDIMHAFMGAMNVSESHPELPGHADKRTTVTLLVPNAEALMKLPVQLSRTNVLAARAQGLMDKLAHPKAAAADLAAAARDAAASVLPKSLNVSGLPPQGYGNATKATDSVARQLVAANTITRMVPFQYLTNATVGLETQAGAPVKVIVSADGQTKYLQAGETVARIVKPYDHGRQLVPIVVLTVDTLFMPPSGFKF